MRVKEIILNNFIKPGHQSLTFDSNQKLKSGLLYDVKILDLVKNLFNGKWQDYLIDFEQFYPKFRRKTNDMNLQMDALIEITPDELEKLNNIVTQLVGRKQKSLLWYYSIRCEYPYIFPIVTLRPSEFKKDKEFLIGNHYDKFFKENISKNELLVAKALNSVSLIREKYYEYKKYPVNINDLLAHKKYLYVLNSFFIHKESFIKKMISLVNEIPDGDIINYGEDIYFYFKLKPLSDFLNFFDFFDDNPIIKEDFQEIIYDTFLVDLEWIYSTKSSVSLLEIRKILLKYHCERILSPDQFFSIINFDLKTDKIMNKTIKQKRFIDLKANPVLCNEKDTVVNVLTTNFKSIKFDEKVTSIDFKEYNITKSSLKNSKK